MPLKLEGDTAVLTGAITVEDAEPLAAWLRDTPEPAVDLSDCTHLHAAALQALLAARATVAAEPADPFLKTWVLPVLAPTDSSGDPQP